MLVIFSFLIFVLAALPFAPVRFEFQYFLAEYQIPLFILQCIVFVLSVILSKGKSIFFNFILIIFLLMLFYENYQDYKFSKDSVIETARIESDFKIQFKDFQFNDESFLQVKFIDKGEIAKDKNKVVFKGIDLKVEFLREDGFEYGDIENLAIDDNGYIGDNFGKVFFKKMKFQDSEFVFIYSALHKDHRSKESSIFLRRLTTLIRNMKMPVILVLRTNMKLTSVANRYLYNLANLKLLNKSDDNFISKKGYSFYFATNVRNLIYNTERISGVHELTISKDIVDVNSNKLVDLYNKWTQ